jgi:putative oxidoreductase
MFPQLARFTGLGLLLLRLMIGFVFVNSGYRHLKDPTGRAKSIPMSKAFTIFLGIAEVAGSLGVAFGVLTQLAAFGLILIMFGAIQKKMFTWHRLLGRERFGLALRSDVGPDEPGRRLHQMAARTS